MDSDEFDEKLKNCNYSYNRVKTSLLHVGRLLTGDMNEEGSTTKYAQKTECEIIPYGGFGLIHVSELFSGEKWRSLDDKLLQYLIPHDVDLMLLCDTCLLNKSTADPPAEQSDILPCKRIAAVVLELLKYVHKDGRVENVSHVDSSYSHIRIKDVTNVEIDVTIANKGENLKVTDAKQLNIEMAIKAYQDFPDDTIETSVRFMRVKVRAALAYAIFQNTLHEAIKKLNKDVKEILQRSKNLEIPPEFLSQFSYTNVEETILLNEMDLARNIGLVEAAIETKNADDLWRLIKASGPPVLGDIVCLQDPNEKQKKQMFVYETIHRNLSGNSETQLDIKWWRILGQLGDIGVMVRVYYEEHKELPDILSLREIINDVEYLVQNEDEIVKPTEIYMLAHGNTNDKGGAIPEGMEYNYWVSGEPGLACYMNFTRYLKDAFINNRHVKKRKIQELNGLTVSYTNPYYLSNIKENEIEGRGIEIYIGNEKVTDASQIYVICKRLLGRSEKKDSSVKDDVIKPQISSFQIHKNIVSKIVSLRDFNTISCLSFIDSDAAETYNKETIPLRTLHNTEGGARVFRTAASLTGLLLIFLGSIVPR